MTPTAPHPLLETYLDDHLAGAVAGVAMLEDIATASAGSELCRTAEALRIQVVEDREALERLIASLGFQESRIRSASAWVAEKLARLKATVDDPARGDFRLFEMLEAISLGIEGKRLLWLALAAASDATTELRGPNYTGLIERAESQRNQLEVCRRLMAVKSFQPQPESDAVPTKSST